MTTPKILLTTAIAVHVTLEWPASSAPQVLYMEASPAWLLLIAALAWLILDGRQR
jgi:hypothetical protein